MGSASVDQAAPATGGVTHPLECLTGDEIRAAVAAVKSDGRLDQHARFATVTLDPPSKEAVASYRPGDAIDRRVRLIIVPGQDSTVIEALVAVPSGEIVSWEERPDVRPALLFDDALRSIIALRESPEWRQAMARRGITELDKVQSTPGRPATSNGRSKMAGASPDASSTTANNRPTTATPGPSKG